MKRSHRGPSEGMAIIKRRTFNQPLLCPGFDRSLNVVDLGRAVQVTIQLPYGNVANLRVEVQGKVLLVSADVNTLSNCGERTMKYCRRFRMHDRVHAEHISAFLSDIGITLIAPYTRIVRASTISSSESLVPSKQSIIV
jgi:HSP20 family molecular chaperone IbpA